MGVFAGFVVVLLFVYSGVGIQHSNDTLLLLPGDDGRVVFFNRYPFGLVLDLLPIAFLQYIVPIVSAVEDVVEDDVEGDRVPFVAGSCAVSFEFSMRDSRTRERSFS